MSAHRTRMKGVGVRQWRAAPADGDGRIRIMVKRISSAARNIEPPACPRCLLGQDDTAGLPVHSPL